MAFRNETCGDGLSLPQIGDESSFAFTIATIYGMVGADKYTRGFFLSEFHDFLDLWRDLYRVERKVIASEFGVSPAQLGRIEAGLAPLSVKRLRTLARFSNTSLNTVLLAFMLMDDNIERMQSDDPGDRFVRWLHEQLAREGRQNETNSAARHFLGRPQSLECVFDQLTHLRDADEGEGPPEATRLSVAASN